MPLLITPPTPFATTAQLPVASVYAVIRKAAYDTDLLRIDFAVSYYASEAARLARAEPLAISSLPPAFAHQASVEQVRAAGDMMQLLENVLAQQLAELLPGATIQNVL